MRNFLFFVGTFLLFQVAVWAQEKPPKVDKINRRVRKQIVLMHESDQYWRMVCLAGKMDEKLPACKKVKAIDLENTRKLRQITKKHGFPNADLIGLDVVGNVFTMIIHSSSIEFQKENLPYLRQAAQTNQYIKPEIALLTDKILVAEKKPQIYGTQFRTEAGKMYLEETIEPEKLNERRAEMNLPTMEDYMKMLEKMYRMPIVRP